MSLNELLPNALLRARNAIGYERGQRYWREGRVIQYAVEGDQVTGVVAGAEDYLVRIHGGGKKLLTACSCPMGLRGDLCKHVIALALHHTAIREGGELRRALPASDEPCFATDAELVAWTDDHHIGFELETSAEILAGSLVRAYSSEWQLRRVLCTKSLGEVGSLDGARRAWDEPRLVQATAVAAAAHLAKVAAEVEAGRVEERTPRAPSAAALAPLWSRLQELRAQLRLGAMPRGRASRAGGTWKVDRDGAAIEWHEATPVRGLNFQVMPVIARLAFHHHVEQTCTCKREPCTHAIALIDATLDRLADPGRLAELQPIAEELMRPPWQRALAELDFAEPGTKPRTAIELWWQIEHELRTYAISPIVKRQLKKGGMSSGTRVSVQRLVAEHGHSLDERDRTIVEALDGWNPGYSTSYPYKAFAALVDHPRVMCDGESIALVRRALGFTAVEAQAPSAAWAVPKGQSSRTPAQAPAGNLRLEPTVDGARFSPRLLGPLLQAFAPGEPLIVIEPEHQRVLMIDVGEEARKLWHAIARHGDTFPPESHAALLERLARVEGKLPLAVAPRLMGELLHEPATVVLRLRITAVATLELEAFVRPARGAPLFPPGVGPREVMVAREGGRGYAKRSFDREHEDVRKALALLPLQDAEEGPPGTHRVNDPDTALSIVAMLEHPPDGIAAEWLDDRPRVLSSPQLQHLRVQIDQKRDWFGVTGQLKVESGRIELAVLLDAARRQQRFVRVDANRWVELSEILRDRLGELADHAFEGQVSKGIELSVGAVPIVQKLVDAGVEVETDQTWRRLGERLGAAIRLRPRPPAALQATLRPYQIEGHAWLARLAAWGAGGCLGDDMGLGKTVQTIALLLDRAKLGPAIVLAPTSVALNWVDELARFAPALRPIVYGEAGDRAATLRALTKKDVLIASYGLLARDAEQLAQREFATLVADEAQALKNPRTERAKAARMLHADFKVALSGTPIENHLGELWSMFALVFPGLLGSWEQFRARFGAPIERDRDERARGALARLIQPFLLRRTKAEVAPELPARTEIVVPIALSAPEAELYEDARLATVAKLDKSGGRPTRGAAGGGAEASDKRRFEVLAALTRLRLLASHPRLYDPSSAIGSSKMQRLLELVEELRSEDHRALVFSQFTSHLALVRAELDRTNVPYLYLDGATPAPERARLVRRFQAGEGDAFLISLKAGGTGINLTGADYVIHLDPWWNPAVEDQATDRAHRIGQDKPVTVYRLVARGTVEENILALHGTKRALVASVLDGTGAAAKLSTRDLFALLG
ncbi:MAG: DEAD/DEAH box helicase [Kofleriaceae bacterium]